jgi:hypothetical protein
MVTTTIVRLAGIEENIAVLDGDFTGEQCRNSLVSFYAQLTNSVFTETTTGATKTVSFSEATGSKQ